jgi:uncharacterized protein (DUF1330 family)
MHHPWFLVLKLPDGTAAAPFAQQASEQRGAVLAAADWASVVPLEPGTAHTGLVILRFAFEDDLVHFFTGLDLPPGTVALACAGLPYEGWPGNFVPTIATVDVPDAGAPRTYMVIEGTGTDQERMDQYRDIILPMMREGGAYYVAFELGGNVRVLAGEWSEGIFAISRWPSRAHAEEFWFSDRYQKTAIPMRNGAGRFDVQIVEGLAG